MEGLGDVSHIEQITGELRAMAAGVDNAHGNAATADAKTQEIAARAARSGFTGIAAGMSQIRNAIAEIRARLAGIGGSINEAATAVAAAPKEMSPEQTIAVLAPMQQKINGVRDQIMATIAKVEQTKQLAAAALRGGQPGSMLATLDSIKQALAPVAQRAGTAKQQLETAVGDARQMGDAGK